jgi:hypothetical protein
MVIDHNCAANFVSVNGADNWLHLVLALGRIGLDGVLRRSTARRMT